jgi:hypothetical protein
MVFIYNMALFVSADGQNSNNNEYNPIDLYCAIITLRGYNEYK